LEDLVFPWLDRLHALVIGPGLSKDKMMLQSARHIIVYAASKQIPLVIDADACQLLHPEDPITLLAPAILTPNYREFSDICSRFVSP
jgi:ATP-dependent NAD(P)H-hydrate dehydratase